MILFQEGCEVEELEKQLEVQMAIIEATKSLVEQAKNRQMKKDRKKEVKMAEDKVLRTASGETWFLICLSCVLSCPVSETGGETGAAEIKAEAV